MWPFKRHLSQHTGFESLNTCAISSFLSSLLGLWFRHSMSTLSILLLLLLPHRHSVIPLELWPFFHNCLSHGVISWQQKSNYTRGLRIECWAIFLLCVHFLHACVCVLCTCLVPKKARRGHCIFWNCSCRWVWAMWLLGTEPWPSAKAASTLNCWSISLATTVLFLQKIYIKFYEDIVRWSWEKHVYGQKKETESWQVLRRKDGNRQPKGYFCTVEKGGQGLLKYIYKVAILDA